MAASIQRNEASGYWGQQLGRREVGNGTVQLHEANAPPEVIVPHGHSHAHIVFVTRGAYVTSVTGENSFVSRPVAVLNPPDIWHRDHFVGGTGSFMTVDFEIEGLARDTAKHYHDPLVLQHCHRLSQSLDAGLNIEIEDALDSLSRLFAEERPDDMAGIPWGIERAYHAIAQSSEPWSLSMAELAHIADVHPNHLPRAFRRRFGFGVSQMIARRQVELCGLALASERDPLAEVALCHGFYDQAHMSSRFRQIANTTPGRWRKNRRRG